MTWVLWILTLVVYLVFTAAYYLNALEEAGEDRRAVRAAKRACINDMGIAVSIWLTVSTFASLVQAVATSHQ